MVLGARAVPVHAASISATRASRPGAVRATHGSARWTARRASSRCAAGPRCVGLFVARARCRPGARGASDCSPPSDLRARGVLLRLRAVLRRARRRIERKRVGVIFVFFMLRGALLGRLRAAGAPRSTCSRPNYTDRSSARLLVPDGGTRHPGTSRSTRCSSSSSRRSSRGSGWRSARATWIRRRP